MDSNNVNEFNRTLIDSLSAQIAILDHAGEILETNLAWREFAGRNALQGPSDNIGLNYLAVCDSASGDDAADARNVAAGIRSVIRGEKDSFLYDYPCHSPTGKHWFFVRVIPMRRAAQDPVRVIVSHEEITPLKLIEEKLRQREKSLLDQKQELQEANIALKVLLNQRQDDQRLWEETMLNNVKSLVLPYVEKLKNMGLSPKAKSMIQVVESQLQEIMTPFLKNLSTAQAILTPQEMQVAGLVRDGKTSKEIAALLTVSEATVNFHRKNLRAKLGLKNQRQGLRAFLLTMSG